MPRFHVPLAFIALLGSMLPATAQINPNKPKPSAAAPAPPPSAYITVGVDVAAEVFINGISKGSVAAGQSKKFTCKPGEVEVRVVDSATRYEHVARHALAAKEATVIQVRLKAEQEAKAAAEQERERQNAEAARHRRKQELTNRFKDAASYGDRRGARSIAIDIESEFPGTVHDCGSCRGEGTVTRQETCGRCRGEGCRTCRDCGGSGQLSCSSCGGSGSGGFGSCFSCNGRGVKGCNCICTRGQNDGLRAVSYGLSGKSEGYVTCDNCYGKGGSEEESDCGRCGGVGQVVY